MSDRYIFIRLHGSGDVIIPLDSADNLERLQDAVADLEDYSEAWIDAVANLETFLDNEAIFVEGGTLTFDNPSYYDGGDI